MPVAVMAENSFSFRKLLEQCETQELEAPGGIATPLVYGQLLALYLLHNDMNNARYLWKRIPPAIKSANAELGAVWSVGQRIWQRDFPGIYTTISAHQWSETILPIMEALRGVLEQGWQADFSTRMVMPKKPGVLEASFNRFIPSSEPAPVPPIPNEQQLARLTDYVAFLEN
ncbi:COP9 signalosome complex subunit 8 isoform 2-T2 [Podargus strigoides]